MMRKFPILIMRVPRHGLWALGLLQPQQVQEEAEGDSLTESF